MAITVQKSTFSRLQAGNIGVISSADPSARERFDPSVMVGQDAGGRALMEVGKGIGEIGDIVRIARQKQELQDLDTELKIASAAYREYQTKAASEENGFNSLKGRNARNGHDAHLAAGEQERLRILYGLSSKAQKIFGPDSLKLREDDRFRTSAHVLRQDEKANLEAHKLLKETIGASISNLPMATATPEVRDTYEKHVHDYMALVFQEMERLGINIVNDPDGRIQKSIIQKHISALNEPILQRMIIAKDPVSALEHLDYATRLGHIDTETRNKFLPIIQTAAQTKAAQEGVDALLHAFGTTTQGRLSETQMLDRVKQYVKDNKLNQTVRDEMKVMIRLRYAAEARDERTFNTNMGHEINRLATDTDRNIRVKKLGDLHIDQQNWLRERPASMKAFREQLQRTADGTIQVTGGHRYMSYLVNITRSWKNTDDGRKARKEFLAKKLYLPEHTLNLGPGEAAKIQAFQLDMQKFDSKAELSAEIKTAAQRKKELDAQKTMTRIERAIKSSLVGAELDAPVVAVILNRVLRVAAEAAERGEILSDEQLLEISRGARRMGEFYEDVERWNGDGTISPMDRKTDTNVLLMNFHAMQSQKKDMTSFFSSRGMLSSAGLFGANSADAARNRQLNEFIWAGTKNTLARVIPGYELTREQILNHITKVERAGKIPTRRTVMQNIEKEFKEQKEAAKTTRRIARAATKAATEAVTKAATTKAAAVAATEAEATDVAAMVKEVMDRDANAFPGVDPVSVVPSTADADRAAGDKVVADILRPVQEKAEEMEDAKKVIDDILNTPGETPAPEVTGKIDELIDIATQIDEQVTTAAAKAKKEEVSGRGKTPPGLRKKKTAARKLIKKLKEVKEDIDPDVSVYDEPKKKEFKNKLDIMLDELKELKELGLPIEPSPAAVAAPAVDVTPAAAAATAEMMSKAKPKAIVQRLMGPRTDVYEKTSDREFVLDQTTLVESFSSSPQDLKLLLTPKGTGEAVVDAAIKAIVRVFTKGDIDATTSFLKNIAAAESKMGGMRGTYRKRLKNKAGEDLSGGSSMWQIDPAGFDDTQDSGAHKSLPAKWKIIKDKFGIDWEKVKYDDLDIPLIGIIAARLFLMNITEALPMQKTYRTARALLNAQGAYWKLHYNTPEGLGEAAAFVRRVQSFYKIPLWKDVAR